LLCEGASVVEIALSRELKESTLYGHCIEAISLECSNKIQFLVVF
jgi:hypothetical protein